MKNPPLLKSRAPRRLRPLRGAVCSCPEKLELRARLRNAFDFNTSTGGMFAAFAIPAAVLAKLVEHVYCSSVSRFVVLPMSNRNSSTPGSRCAMLSSPDCTFPAGTPTGRWVEDSTRCGCIEAQA